MLMRVLNQAKCDATSALTSNLPVPVLCSLSAMKLNSSYFSLNLVPPWIPLRPSYLFRHSRAPLLYLPLRQGGEKEGVARYSEIPDDTLMYRSDGPCAPPADSAGSSSARTDAIRLSS